MKNLSVIYLLMLLVFSACGDDDSNMPEPSVNADFDITTTSIIYDSELEQLVFSIDVEGLAGATIPDGVGQLDGAPVMGYVFPTDLAPTDVGFSETDGILAMALTSHPDFDDTPLWDENLDQDYLNDGAEWHPHWVVLTNDDRVDGGLSVKQFDPNDTSVNLPPTNPGMPMYMDSPGFQVVTEGSQIRTVIPTAAINGKNSFNFDAVSAYMQVNTSAENLPMLGVYEVYKIASGDLSLPFTVN